MNQLAEQQNNALLVAEKMAVMVRFYTNYNNQVGPFTNRQRKLIVKSQSDIKKALANLQSINIDEFAIPNARTVSLKKEIESAKSSLHESEQIVSNLVTVFKNMAVAK